MHDSCMFLSWHRLTRVTIFRLGRVETLIICFSANPLLTVSIFATLQLFMHSFLTFIDPPMLSLLTINPSTYNCGRDKAKIGFFFQKNKKADEISRFACSICPVFLVFLFYDWCTA